jgi:membrane-bound lytic murein transglycosylase B
MSPLWNFVPVGIAPRKIRKNPARIFSLSVSAIFFLLFSLGSVRPAVAWSSLVNRLTVDGFERPAVEALFARAEVRFEPDAMADKIGALLRSRSTPDSMIARLKQTIRRDYLSRRSVARARAYIGENRAILEEIDILYGVPKEIVVSILLIETRLGQSTGNSRVFNRLASMAINNDLEAVRPHLNGEFLTSENEEFARSRCREKGDWAYEELKALLRFAERNGIDPLGIRGSVYGAIGQCQFMPSNIFSYGVDADHDGRIDPFAKADALHSIANYLRGYGWRPGLDRDGRHRVIFGYNHSTVYANTVLAIAEKLTDPGRPRP